VWTEPAIRPKSTVAFERWLGKKLRSILLGCERIGHERARLQGDDAAYCANRKKMCDFVRSVYVCDQLFEEN
jgi:hypothetical protein